MRLAVLGLLAAGCGQVAVQRDAASNADSNAPSDSTGSTTSPTFVQHFFGDGGSEQRYKMSTPGTGSGRLLVMIITYNSPVIQVDSVNEDSGVPLRRVSEPLLWTSSGHTWKTEVWAGRRTQNSVFTTVMFTGAPPGFSYFYGSEFVATEIDQVAAKTGMRNFYGAFSSGSRTTQYPNELVFGHGEGEGSVLSPGKGFTVRRGGGDGGGGVLEQTMPAATPGVYEAPFSMDRAGHWFALMLTLR